MDFKRVFTSFSVKNIEDAKNFYTGKLEATVKMEQEWMVMFSLTDHEFVVYQKQDHVPATYTVLNFEVYDIDSAVSDLSEKGINFENYNTEYIQTDHRGIADQGSTKMAWFKDPSGNILGLMENN